MKKFIAILLLCGVAQLQGLTVTNGADFTIKLGLQGDAIGGIKYYILRPGEDFNATLKPGQIDILTANKFFDLAVEEDLKQFQSVVQQDKCQELKIECVGNRRGVLMQQLAIIRRSTDNAILNKDHITFNGSSFTR